MYTSHSCTKTTSSINFTSCCLCFSVCALYIQTSRHCAHTLHRPGSVFTKPVASPLTTHGRVASYLATPEANNTSHVQVSINRSFDGGCREFQGGGVHAGIPGVPTGGGGGVWSSFGTRGEKWRSWRCGGDFSGQCFYRSRRVTTLEPQHTLAAVSGGDGERIRGRSRESGDKLD